MQSGRTSLFIVALGTGCLPTFLLSLNSEIVLHAGPVLGSWIVHGTGTLAAMVLLVIFSRTQSRPLATPGGRPPLWAFMGGFTGAFNVMLGSTAVNAGLALSGTQAVALSGQMLFGLVADRWGILGLPRRPVTLRDIVPVALIIGGSLIIILYGSEIAA